MGEWVDGLWKDGICLECMSAHRKHVLSGGEYHACSKHGEIRDVRINYGASMTHKEAMQKHKQAIDLRRQLSNMRQEWIEGPVSARLYPPYADFADDKAQEFKLEITLPEIATAEHIETALKLRRTFDDWVAGKIDEMPKGNRF